MNSLDMKIMKPSLLKIITNKISANFIITPYFDNEFNLEEFKAGAEHAIVAVSSALANGNTTELEVVGVYFNYKILTERMDLFAGRDR